MSDIPEDLEVVTFPEEAIQFLPEEWQKALLALKEETKGILASADGNLNNLNRLIHAFPTMVSLRYIHHRLASTEFEATMEWALENDMLTLAFVTTYARLIRGGLGSGIARDVLPPKLRPIHDNIIELRNKRYAHNEGHDSIGGELSIGFDGEKFQVGVQFNMGFHVGGAKQWSELVEFLDHTMYERLHVQLGKLKDLTGKEWSFPSGAPPSWIQVKSGTPEAGGNSTSR